jgi:S1/P1 Nuclease
MSCIVERSYRQWVFVFLILVATPVRALAWGYDCHRIIAEIAEQFLEPPTARLVRELLSIENVTTLDDVSIWADEIRLQRPETRSWHFVNIPITPAAEEPRSYDAIRDCPQDNCIIAKIEHFELVLADRQAPDRQRLEALKYLVHFVGDLHQPLHVSNNQDRGGNNLFVIFRGLSTNLHAVWDTEIIRPALGPDDRSYAMKLAQTITPDEIESWSKGDPVAWANEGYEIAARIIYGELPHSGTLPEDYETKVLPIVNEQLERAGVRLAEVLNTCLRHYP